MQADLMQRMQVSFNPYEFINVRHPIWKVSKKKQDGIDRYNKPMAKYHICKNVTTKVTYIHIIKTMGCNSIPNNTKEQLESFHQDQDREGCPPHSTHCISGYTVQTHRKFKRQQQRTGGKKGDPLDKKFISLI